MTFAVKSLLLCAVALLVIESTKAKDLKELAKEMREKRELQAVALLEEKAASELSLQAPLAADGTEVVSRNKRSGGCGRGGGGGCGGGGGGCGCCCCCCCCCCGGGGGGCGRKKRQILTILRARRNSLADDILKEAANDWSAYSGNDNGKGFGTSIDVEQSQNNNNNKGGDENCAECDE